MDLVRDLEIAFKPAEQIAERQAELLRAHALYCREHSPYYREVLRDRELPLDGKMEELLSSLPLTRKCDIERANDTFCAVRAEQIVDVVMSSGTTGRPTKITYTEHDLQRLAYNEEKAFLSCGLGRDDVLLLTCTMDRCFVAGLAYFLGSRSLGAACIRNGHGTLDSHAEMIKRTNPTAVVGVPSFLRKLGSHLKDRGIDPAGTSVTRIVAIGEPLRDREMNLSRVGQDIERTWGARVYSTYASSETITTFCECVEQNGGHLHPDLAVVEIIDERGNRLAAGEIGEVVVTPLAVEGMPLLRFRTGDVSFLLDQPCDCGRNAVRLGPVLGRKSEMLKVRGTTLYPPAILAALAEIDGVTDFYVSARSTETLSDEVTAHVALRDKTSLSAEDIAARLQARLRVRPDVVVEPEGHIRQVVYDPKQRKPIRFVRE